MSNITGGVVFRDFAGSTVVHTVGGVIALAGAIVLGPRLGRKFKRDGGGPMPAHDLTSGAIGGVILWFGWYGFNPGSTLSAMDWEGIGRVAANTTLAACAGGLVAVLVVYPTVEEVGPRHLGATASSAASSPSPVPCYWVSPFGSVVSARSPASWWCSASTCSSTCGSTTRSARWRCTCSAGIWGTLSLGLFAAGQLRPPDARPAPTPTTVVNGLFYGGSCGHQLKAQFIGSMTCDHLRRRRRASSCSADQADPGFLEPAARADGELEGLDIFEHGTPAYHMEFGYGMSYTTPAGGLPGTAPSSERRRRRNRSAVPEADSTGPSSGGRRASPSPVGLPTLRSLLQVPSDRRIAWLIS